MHKSFRQLPSVPIPIPAPGTLADSTNQLRTAFKDTNHGHLRLMIQSLIQRSCLSTCLSVERSAPAPSSHRLIHCRTSRPRAKQSRPFCLSASYSHHWLPVALLSNPPVGRFCSSSFTPGDAQAIAAPPHTCSRACVSFLVNRQPRLHPSEPATTSLNNHRNRNPRTATTPPPQPLRDDYPHPHVLI